MHCASSGTTWDTRESFDLESAGQDAQQLIDQLVVHQGDEEIGSDLRARNRRRVRYTAFAAAVYIDAERKVFEAQPLTDGELSRLVSEGRKALFIKALRDMVSKQETPGLAQALLTEFTSESLATVIESRSPPNSDATE